MRIKIKYNSPVILTYGVMSVAVFLTAVFSSGNIIPAWFSVPGSFSDFKTPLSFFRLFTHTLGHANWGHLAGNFTIILLIGPVLEEKYGSAKILGMMLAVSAVTGLLHIFLSGKLLFGASGVVFMMIILVSFTNMGRMEIPLTMILVIIIFLLKEIVGPPVEGVSHLSHIAGGICGVVFGFINAKHSRGGT